MRPREIVTLLVLVAAILICVFCAPVPTRAAEQCGLKASWYGSESGNRTASGKKFTGREMLVAHKTLPFGTMVRLRYGSRSVTVAVEDRGPYIAGRVLDVSEAVAERLGMKQAGVVRLCMEVLR